MNKRKLAINIIYTVIFFMAGIISYMIIRKTSIETDSEAPILTAVVDGSSVIINASDNVGVYAYTYNATNKIPSTWYEASNTKEFNTKLRIVNDGTYYIWAKDEFGNVSETTSFSLACEKGSFLGIEKKVYCPYSKINVFGYNWHVLEDSEGYITLFMDSGELDKKFSHCSNKESSTFCYSVDNNFKAYSWSSSMINYYLNNDFKKTFQNVTFKDASVCNDESGVRGCIDNDGCGGYLAQDVNEIHNFCRSQYVASSIRLLTISEYNRILIDLEKEDKSWVYGEEPFWTMNAWRNPTFASSIIENGVFKVDENTTTYLDIRPVIVVKK